MTEGGRPIEEVARLLALEPEDVVPVGRGKAKIASSALGRSRRGEGRLILVSAMTPTPSGEGKTTVSIGLAMALSQLGKRAALGLRQPSLGPVFGKKGGATGGRRAALVPADDINLHFTGDFHAVTSAHNLLAALADNDLHFGGRLDPRRITWPRVVDMNDRALRHVVVGLGGPNDGVPRESRFDITAASEVMAVLCLAHSETDLLNRLARIVVGRTKAGEPVTADELGATGAMGALLQTAFEPNLVQTLEGTPALVHGGPFANIAHGTSSVLSTRLAMHYADEVVVEAGFGFDLGGEKFLHLACPVGGFWPDCVVLVVTARALAHHGGAESGADAGFVEHGLPQLDHHVASARAFGLDPIVAINVFEGDPEESLALVERHCNERGISVARTTAFMQGGSGALDLAQRVSDHLARNGPNSRAMVSLYSAEDPFLEKLRKIARSLYRARDVILTEGAKNDLARFAAWGFGTLPPCVAKTQLSLSDDPTRTGTPQGFDVTIDAVRLSAGAGFLVALAGGIQTMPGLPREPAARRMRVDSQGRILGVARET